MEVYLLAPQYFSYFLQKHVATKLKISFRQAFPTFPHPFKPTLPPTTPLSAQPFHSAPAGRILACPQRAEIIRTLCFGGGFQSTDGGSGQRERQSGGVDGTEFVHQAVRDAATCHAAAEQVGDHGFFGACTLQGGAVGRGGCRLRRPAKTQYRLVLPPHPTP